MVNQGHFSSLDEGTADKLNSALLQRGTAAARPAAGQEGRTYFATDTFAWSRDNGSTWDALDPAGISTQSVGYNRAAAAASGNVGHTGAGFTPKGAIILAQGIDGNDSVSIGYIDDGGVLNCNATRDITGTPVVTQPTSAVRASDATGVNIQEATDWVSWDSDGMTLTWTKSGTGEQASFLVLYLR